MYIYIYICTYIHMPAVSERPQLLPKNRTTGSPLPTPLLEGKVQYLYTYSKWVMIRGVKGIWIKGIRVKGVRDRR
jgi:hypothetical protein